MVLTEDKLKMLYKKEKITKFYMEEGDILTPSARQFLSENNIEIVKGKKIEEEKNELKTSQEFEKLPPVPKYKGLSGESYFEKPEYMTQLKGNILVKKNSFRIRLRGKIDIFLARWIILQKEFEEYKNQNLNRDMESVTALLKKIVIAEVLDENIGEIQVLGENLNKIKEVSHNPKKFYGMDHLFSISSKNNMITLKLNEMRSLVREVEISAIDAFVNENGEIKREDLLLIFNRLSSIIYVMMLKGEKDEYGNR